MSKLEKFETVFDLNTSADNINNSLMELPMAYRPRAIQYERRKNNALPWLKDKNRNTIFDIDLA